jgi:hypothetical protein
MRQKDNRRIYNWLVLVLVTNPENGGREVEKKEKNGNMGICKMS